jgi:hypothetical protein
MVGHLKANQFARHSTMSTDEKVNEEGFVPVTIIVNPGQETRLSFDEYPDFFCQFNVATRTDPTSTGKVELFAEIKTEESETGNSVTQKLKWVEFAEGESERKHIDLVVDTESEVKLTVVGDGGITLTGEVVPSFDDEEEEEEDGNEEEEENQEAK